VYYSQEFPTFLDGYNGMSPVMNLTELNLGGRLIPRDVVQGDVKGLTSAMRAITVAGAVISGVTLNVGQQLHPDNAVTPVWRTAVFDAVIGIPFNQTSIAVNVAAQELITSTLMPMLEKLTPGGGSYLNEGDYRQPDFQQAFYGGKYQQLLAIKAKYDPKDLFYAVTAVGSDKWTQEADGRLCRSVTQSPAKRAVAHDHL